MSVDLEDTRVSAVVEALRALGGKLGMQGMQISAVIVAEGWPFKEGLSVLTPCGSITVRAAVKRPGLDWLATYNAALSGGQSVVLARTAADLVHGEWKP